ncbi:hypothetical protein CYD70_19930 [Klebsiella pneumoniae]|nr:hypothetical protein CYD65_21060 [Klebsiella pneumoniae]PKT30337.1 hypothetical protein CYD63_20125 [Klebsiella pneumoniae]PKT35876.1 hypothetical protein CYD70_19930 [Klebsiella pneumoniae]PKT46884.1 hypothetical protein CYD77_19655 [Klebsiella pneumoniae]
MMSLWDALRMNMMISYQELVRTFPKAQHYLLVLRLRDRFLIHIIVKHVAEQSMTVRRNHEKTLARQERPCSVF